MDDSTLLDNYFNGLLSAEEVRTVLARVETDPEFREAFTLRQKMESFPRRETERAAFVSTLRTVGAEYFAGKTGEPPSLRIARNNVRRWMALAASLTLLAAAIWFFNRPTTPTYAQYASHAPLSLTVMGNTEQAKTEAEAAFGQKDYAGALSALAKVLALEPDNLKAKFYQGICLLELQRAAEARAVFEPLAAGQTALREDAVWYVGLSYLQEQNIEACKTTLASIQQRAAHYKEAQEILKGL